MTAASQSAGSKPSCSYSDQANVPGKATKDGPSTCTPDTHVGDPVQCQASGFYLNRARRWGVRQFHETCLRFYRKSDTLQMIYMPTNKSNILKLYRYKQANNTDFKTTNTI